MIARFSIATVFAVTMLSGRVLDRTTGQPLPHVLVSSGTTHATTDASGKYALRGLKPGEATITLESDDVPAQHFAIQLHGTAMRGDFRACSTTLDYNCSGPALPNTGAGAGSGAG